MHIILCMQKPLCMHAHHCACDISNSASIIPEKNNHIFFVIRVESQQKICDCFFFLNGKIINSQVTVHAVHLLPALV